MLSDELRALLLDAGAKLAGFADMSGAAGCTYPRAVSVALPVPRHILREIADGPTKSYYYMYHELNNGLNRIVTSGAEFLRARGYAAEPLTTDVVTQTPDHRTVLPHKTAAVRAGLGWIGRNCLLVTPQYGPAVRISTLLTDAPLDCARPLPGPRCGECRACADACPAQALSGNTWTPGTDREELVNAGKCIKKQFELMKARTGLDFDICGKCFAVCPYARHYLEMR